MAAGHAFIQKDITSASCTVASNAAAVAAVATVAIAVLVIYKCNNCNNGNNNRRQQASGAVNRKTEIRIAYAKM